MHSHVSATPNAGRPSPQVWAGSHWQRGHRPGAPLTDPRPPHAEAPLPGLGPGHPAWLRSTPGSSPVILCVSRTHSRPELPERSHPLGQALAPQNLAYGQEPRWQIPPGQCGSAGHGEGKLPRIHEAEKWPQVLTTHLGGTVHRQPLEGVALRRGWVPARGTLGWASLLLCPGSGAQ